MRAISPLRQVLGRELIRLRAASAAAWLWRDTSAGQVVDGWFVFARHSFHFLWPALMHWPSTKRMGASLPEDSAAATT